MKIIVMVIGNAIAMKEFVAVHVSSLLLTLLQYMIIKIYFSGAISFKERLFSFVILDIPLDCQCKDHDDCLSRSEAPYCNTKRKCIYKSCFDDIDCGRQMR